MAKNTVTISMSIPNDVDKKLRELAELSGTTNSAVVTAILSIAFKWMETRGAEQKKQILNSVYGKRD